MRLKNIICVTILFLMMWITGCKEITTNTTIYPDGSCDRHIEIEGDSSTVLDYSYFPIPKDSTWIVSQHHDLGHDSDTKYTAKKHFQKISDLDNELAASRKNSLQIGVQVGFEKRFRWFNTFYVYRENYFKSNPFQHYPVSDFLTGEEVELYLMDEDTLDLNDQVDLWMEKNIFEEFFQGLLVSCRMLGDSNLTEVQLIKNKDTLFNVIETANFEEDFPFEEHNAQKFLVLLEKVLVTKQLWNLEESLKSHLREMKRKYDFISTIHLDNFKNRVTMPGLIISTNAENIEGNQVSWELRGTALFFKDYEMRVESRIVNPWALGVSGGMVFLIIVFLVMTSIRKRQA